MQISLNDTVTLDAGANVRVTGDGYLTAAPRIARTGVQLYRGSELGRKDLSVVRVFRPEESVFDKDALASMAHRPMTNDHPPVAVNAKNWKDYAIGQSGAEVARDGEFIRVPRFRMASPNYRSATLATLNGPPAPRRTVRRTTPFRKTSGEIILRSSTLRAGATS
jgi:hypothetical protein